MPVGARWKVVLGAFLILNAACDGFYTVSGRVESCATRKPIAEAKLTLRIDDPKQTGTAESRENGSFLVSVNALPDDKQPSDLSVKKDGYRDYDAHITNPEANQFICLTPVASPPPPPHAP